MSDCGVPEPHDEHDLPAENDTRRCGGVAGVSLLAALDQCRAELADVVDERDELSRALMAADPPTWRATIQGFKDRRLQRGGG